MPHAKPAFKTSLRILGFGKVGQRASVNARDAGINVACVADSTGAAWLNKPDPLEVLIERKKLKGALFSADKHSLQSLIAAERGSVLADCSASSDTGAMLLKALDGQQSVVLANKKPLTASPELFTALTSHPRVRFEATVGAGLPVMVTARRMLACKDEISLVTGQLSGTLGYILSRLSSDVPFSQAVKEAEEKGYTEPDPRDDLSGVDVGRKALILARYALGMPSTTMEQLDIEPLYPKEFAALPLDAFRARLGELDAGFRDKMASAKSRGQVLRYAAQVSRDGVKVGLVETPLNSPLGALNGTSNLVSFRSRMYPQGQETVVIGPGAGVAVTAAAVVADAVDVLQMRAA
jgi:homoserine dehydrogenase